MEDEKNGKKQIKKIKTCGKNRQEISEAMIANKIRFFYSSTQSERQQRQTKGIILLVYSLQCAGIKERK